MGGTGVDETILEEQQSETAEERAAGHELHAEPRRPLWQEQLLRAADQSDRRMERWIVDQRRRVADGLDMLLIDFEHRRQEEIARLDQWRASARKKVEDELAQERERFSAQMLEELKAFEEQLLLRLQEQEEKLARWWDEAEMMASQRFAALGLEKSPPPS
jgi:hypothetical protein